MGDDDEECCQPVEPAEIRQFTHNEVCDSRLMDLGALPEIRGRNPL